MKELKSIFQEDGTLKCCDNCGQWSCIKGNVCPSCEEEIIQEVMKPTLWDKLKIL